jgi:hypothetical protein
MFILNVYGLFNDATRGQTISRRMDVQTASNESERQWKEQRET